MIMANFDEQVVSTFLTLRAILLMMGSRVMFNRVIEITDTVVNVDLSDLEKHQER